VLQLEVFIRETLTVDALSWEERQSGSGSWVSPNLADLWGEDARGSACPLCHARPERRKTFYHLG
jgi:hypothetical protein